MIVQGSFTIAVPIISTFIKTIKFGLDASCLNIDLRDIENPNGATGANANAQAQHLADLLNFLSTNVSVVFLRNNNNLNATVLNNVVTVNLLIDDACCDEQGWITPNGDEEPVEGKPFNFAGAVSDMACSPVIPPSAEDCGNYPPNSHVFRFRFINDLGLVFGALGDDYRPVINPLSTITGCLEGSPFQYNPSLSTQNYSDLISFCNGWCANLQGYYWAPLYNGTATHLGGGVIEIVTSIQAWADKSLPDICSVGLGVQCTYVGTPVSGGLTTEIIEQYCCVPDPPSPPVPPIINPPKNIDETIVTDESCEFYTLFDCCQYGRGGVKRVIFQDRANFQGVCLDLFGIITAINTTSPVWFEPCLNDNTSLTIEMESNEKGIRFNHTLNCGVNVMTHFNRLGMMELLYKKLLVIIVDYNDRAWLLGEDYPVKIRAMSSNTGGESSNHFFDFINESRRHARGIEKELVDNLLINQPVDCGDYIGVPLGTYTLNELKDCFLFDMKDNYLN
jgi:hypothetical protein